MRPERLEPHCSALRPAEALIKYYGLVDPATRGSDGEDSGAQA